MCGDCEHWKRIAGSDEGACEAKVLWPDARYARGNDGFRRPMRETEGKNCPTFKEVGRSGREII